MNRIEHREKEWQFPFVEYSPEKTEEKLPLIIQLHGAGERGNGLDELHLVERHGFSKLLKNNTFKCIFIMPQCAKNTFWMAKTESLLSFIEKVIERYNVDRNKVYLTGISMGGFGTWFIAMAKPSLFAAIAPVCGGGMLWNAGVINMPVWVFHSEDDPVVSILYADEMVNSLRNKGIEVRYSRFKGLGHNAWECTFDTGLLQWLLSKSKEN